MPTATELAAYLDSLLGVREHPDYPNALNGLQLDHRGPVRAVAAAVDFSLATIDATIAARANFLILHHGMFWAGPQRLVGPPYQRLSSLVAHDIAVYAAHLPLDAHPEYGNCALLAGALDLEPRDTFASYDGVPIGVSGHTDCATADLLTRCHDFAAPLGGCARASTFESRRRTQRWAIVTGAGGDSRTLAEAAARGIDTLIVGEGPHHTTVDAPDMGLVVIYAGHYATETLGVRTVAAHLGERFGLPTHVLHLPTGS